MRGAKLQFVTLLALAIGFLAVLGAAPTVSASLPALGAIVTSPSPTADPPVTRATTTPTATATTTRTVTATRTASVTATPSVSPSMTSTPSVSATTTAFPNSTKTTTPSPSPSANSRLSATAACTQGTWVGLPYLKRFYNSDCSTYVAANSFSDLTISATNPSYIVYMENNVTVSAGGTMTVTQGVTLNASSGSALYVQGNLDLSGTASAPITLTARSGSAGGWLGIGFRPGSSGNLDHVVIEDGGEYPIVSSQGNGYTTNLLVETAALTVSNATIAQSASNGIEIVNGGNPILQNDSFQANAGAAVKI